MRKTVLVMIVLAVLMCGSAMAQDKQPWEQAGTEVGQEIIGPDGGTMVWMPAGEFLMGSEEGWDDERPVHRVTLDGFWLSKHEVTNAQYLRFVEATGHRCPEVANFGEPVWRGRSFPAEKSSHPVVCVSWEDARAYCEHYGLSLPTEAQWEYAARGDDGRLYPWGNQWPPPAGAGNFADMTAKGKFPQLNVIAGYDDGYAETSPAGSFAANPYGVYDLAGNVFEWCADWYSTTYYWASPELNPPGPADGELKVLRGGSWLIDNPRRFRCASRSYYYRYSPVYRDSSFGFRCARGL
jgi:formylglycine-generating enzyme